MDKCILDNSRAVAVLARKPMTIVVVVDDAFKISRKPRVSEVLRVYVVVGGKNRPGNETADHGKAQGRPALSSPAPLFSGATPPTSPHRSTFFFQPFDHEPDRYLP